MKKTDKHAVVYSVPDVVFMGVENHPPIADGRLRELQNYKSKFRFTGVEVVSDETVSEMATEILALRKDSAEHEAKQLHDIAMLTKDRAELRKENAALMEGME